MDAFHPPGKQSVGMDPFDLAAAREGRALQCQFRPRRIHLSDAEVVCTQMLSRPAAIHELYEDRPDANGAQENAIRCMEDGVCSGSSSG